MEKDHPKIPIRVIEEPLIQHNDDNENDDNDLYDKKIHNFDYLDPKMKKTETQEISFYSHLSQELHPNHKCVLTTLIIMTIVCSTATIYIIFYYLYFLQIYKHVSYIIMAFWGFKFFLVFSIASLYIYCCLNIKNLILNKREFRRYGVGIISLRMLGSLFRLIYGLYSVFKSEIRPGSYSTFGQKRLTFSVDCVLLGVIISSVLEVTFICIEIVVWVLIIKKSDNYKFGI